MGVETLETWQLWYQDTFDREAPRKVEAEGEGLEKGLYELWKRHLSETVMEGGGRGFARFNLWWVEAGKSVEVVGGWGAQLKLRGWVYKWGKFIRTGRKVQLDEGLLQKIASVHADLIRGGETSERILDAVSKVGSKAEYVAWLEMMG